MCTESLSLIWWVCPVTCIIWSVSLQAKPNPHNKMGQQKSRKGRENCISIQNPDSFEGKNTLFLVDLTLVLIWGLQASAYSMFLLSLLIPLRIHWFLLLFYIWTGIYISHLQGEVFVAPVVAGTENTTVFTLLIVLVFSSALIQLERCTLPQTMHSFFFLSLDWMTISKCTLTPWVPFCFHLKLKL